MLDELGLVAALTNLCDRLTQQTGLLIRRDLPSDPLPLTADGELVIYRVAQESLTNVIRHAQAREAEVGLCVRERHVELVVADDGVGYGGPDAASDGGVRSMRERAVLLGGQVSWASSRSGGTEVRLRVPVAGTDP